MLSQLCKWNIAMPIAIGLGLPLVVNEVIVLDAETQLTAAFLLVAGIVHNEGGPAIAAALTSAGDKVAADMNEVDESLLTNVRDSIKVNTDMMDIEGDMKSVHTLVDDLAVVQAENLNAMEEHKFRDAVAKKLDQLAAAEDTAVHSMKTRMISKVQADVATAFKADKKAKEAALAQALAVLASPGAKMGKDVVGDYFVSAVKTYRESYAKQPAGSDPILAQLEKDVAAIIAAPAVGHSGGNVYETHPIAVASGKK